MKGNIVWGGGIETGDACRIIHKAARVTKGLCYINITSSVYSLFKRLRTERFLVMCQMKEYAIIIAHLKKGAFKSPVHRTPICLIYLQHWQIIPAEYGIGKTVYFTWLECLSSAAGVCFSSNLLPFICIYFSPRTSCRCRPLSRPRLVCTHTERWNKYIAS